MYACAFVLPHIKSGENHFCFTKTRLVHPPCTDAELLSEITEITHWVKKLEGVAWVIIDVCLDYGVISNYGLYRILLALLIGLQSHAFLMRYT